MEYELKALEQIVSVIERHKKLKPGKQDAALLGKYKRRAHMEKERIKLQFIHAAFEPGSEGRIELYFHQHQVALVQLSDCLYNGSKMQSIDKLSMEVMNSVEFLLHFIETQFVKYFNRNIKIPESKRWQMAPEIKRTLKILQTSFKEYEVPEDLIKIMCQPLEEYLLPDTAVNYREFYFIKDMQHELLSLSKMKVLNNYT